MNISFAQYISEIDFLSYFDKEILPKKGGGRDHMSPSSYRKTFINEIEWLKAVSYTHLTLPTIGG